MIKGKFTYFENSLMLTCILKDKQIELILIDPNQICRPAS